MNLIVVGYCFLILSPKCLNVPSVQICLLLLLFAISVSITINHSHQKLESHTVLPILHSSPQLLIF